jgi:hypothetical protein
MGWVGTYFDNSYWYPGGYAGYWNTDHWQSSGPGMLYINPLGSWADAYRPTKVKITLVGSASYFKITDTAGNYFQDNSYSNEKEVDISFSYNIAQIIMGYGSFGVYGISFYEEGGSPPAAIVQPQMWIIT